MLAWILEDANMKPGFLIDGPELQHNKKQIAIETELLEALSA